MVDDDDGVIRAPKLHVESMGWPAPGTISSYVRQLLLAQADGLDQQSAEISRYAEEISKRREAALEEVALNNDRAKELRAAAGLDPVDEGMVG